MTSHDVDAPSQPIEPGPSRRARYRSLAAVMGSMAGMAMFYGYTGPLLSIVLHDQEVSGSLIGFNGAFQMAGVFIALPFLPMLIRRLGPARLMMIGAAVALATILLMGAFIDVWVWFPLRLMMGAAQSMMWTTGETWINHSSDDRSRGRTVSLYMSVIAAGFASGPFLQAEVGAHGILPFLVGAAIILVITLPLFAGLGDRITTGGRPTVRLPQYIRLAPVPMFSNLFFAMVASSLMALLAVYGLRLEMHEGSAARMIGWMGWGGVFMPLLIGVLADRMDRTLLLAWFVGLGAVATAALPWIVDMGWLLAPAYLMLFGGLRAGHYGLAVMLLGERFRGADLPSATAVFGAMFGIGSVMGPAISGLAIDVWDPHGLPLVVALFYLIFLPMPLIAYLRRKRGI
jgi:MFS family permease